MSNQVLDLIRSRSTTNLFDSSFTLSDEEIASLVTLATTAPTSFNLQNWRFIAVRTQWEKDRLRSVAWDQAKVSEASVTFIVVGQFADPSTLAARLQLSVDAGLMPESMIPGWVGAAESLYKDKPQPQRDEAIRTGTFGAMTLIHAAQAMGLGSAPMIGFDPVAVSEQFGLKSNEIPVMLLAVGRALPENWPQKPRRPIHEVLSYL